MAQLPLPHLLLLAQQHLPLLRQLPPAQLHLHPQPLHALHLLLSHPQPRK